MNDHLADFDSSVQDFAKSKDVAKMGAKQLKDEFAASTIQTQAQNKSLSSVRKVLNGFNDETQRGGMDQKEYVKSVKKSNQALGSYLETVKDGKATMFGFGMSVAKSGAGDMLLNLGTSVLNGLVSAGISAIVSLLAQGIFYTFDALHEYTEEAKEAMSEAFTEYDDAKEKVAALNTELEKTNGRIAELESKKITGGLTFVEDQELTNLKKASTELEHQVDVAERVESTKKNAAAAKAINAYQKEFRDEISTERIKELENQVAIAQQTGRENPITILSGTGLSGQIASLSYYNDELQKAKEIGDDLLAQSHYDNIGTLKKFSDIVMPPDAAIISHQGAFLLSL